MTTLASFKLQFVEQRVRVFPTQIDGVPFRGPGVDILGDAASGVFERAKPLAIWLRAREPDIALRSLSIDLESGRVLLTFTRTSDESRVPPPRPQSLRIDPPLSNELLELAAPLAVDLATQARAAIERRGSAP